MAIATINPATGETLRSFDPLNEKDIEATLERAIETFRFYRRMPFPERARLMMRAAEILETGSEDFGRLMTIEMGKPLRAAIEEAAKCGWACRYYAENAERFLADEVVATNASRSFVHYQPIGPVLAINVRSRESAMLQRAVCTTSDRLPFSGHSLNAWYSVQFPILRAWSRRFDAAASTNADHRRRYRPPVRDVA